MPSGYSPQLHKRKYIGKILKLDINGIIHVVCVINVNYRPFMTFMPLVTWMIPFYLYDNMGVKRSVGTSGMQPAIINAEEKVFYIKIKSILLLDFPLYFILGDLKPKLSTFERPSNSIFDRPCSVHKWLFDNFLK